MKGYDLVGRYEYKLPKKVGKILKKTISGNRSKILKGVQTKARNLRNKKKWIIITENKSKHYFSLYVLKE